MVRKEVVVAILALAIGALGCGDDSAGAGGAGGAGGTAGVGGTGGVGGMGGGGLTTACIDEPDLSAATSIEFSGQFWGCYDTADMDIVASVDSCLQETPGLSGGCSDCYGEYAGCIDTNCGESCNERGTDTLPCSQCVAAECNLGLTSCTGVASPSVEPQ